jgi:hypothetical protein
VARYVLTLASASLPAPLGISQQAKWGNDGSPTSLKGEPSIAPTEKRRSNKKTVACLSDVQSVAGRMNKVIAESSRGSCKWATRALAHGDFSLERVAKERLAGSAEKLLSRREKAEGDKWPKRYATIDLVHRHFHDHFVEALNLLQNFIVKLL